MLCAIGLNHSSAPLELRERLAYSDSTRAEALSALKGLCSEAVVLDTCNRSEIYAYDPVGRQLAGPLGEFLSAFHNLPADTLQAYLYAFNGPAAVSHLFAVASGIDSLVVGEAQILSQVHDAFAFASTHASCGPVLSALFRQALSAGKRARTETAIGRGAISLGSVGIERAQAILGSLEGRTALLIGAGKMSTLAAHGLQAAGAEPIWVASRTLAHAQELAARIDALPIPFEEMARALKRADVVFTSTAAPHLILTYEMVSTAMAGREQPLCIIDLALPRDVDPAVADIPGVRLVDLDGLQDDAQQTLAQRRSEVCKVQAIVDEEAESVWRWTRALGVTPTIAALRRRAEQIRQSELLDHEGRLHDLSPITP